MNIGSHGPVGVHDQVITSWVKSSYSETGADCVEVARTTLRNVAVRDSKNPGCPVLRFTSATWQDFVQAITASEL